jgi:hypothetical protein
MSKKIQIALAISCLTAALFVPKDVRAAAGGVQNCTTGSTCTIGEFLFDDLSAPIAGASCTITAKYPDQSSFLAGQVLSGGAADGWYYYSFTAPATLGVYPTTISCVVSGDTLSIDKSFQVNAASSSDPNAVASAVWNYSTRTVSTFGSLISDVWANTTRTLTGAGLSTGSLATKSDVTNISSGTTNNTTNITNTTDNSVVSTINDIKSLSQQNRLLLEQVVNKPVIQNVLEEVAPPISEKLNDTRAQANQLYINNQFLTSQTATLAAGWNGMSGKDALDAVISISAVLGESADSSSTNTMFGQTNWIKDSWNWNEVASAYDQLTSAQSLISDLKDGLANYQKTPALLSEVKQLVKSSVSLEKIVGTVTDNSDQKTLFAKIASTQTLATNLDEKSMQINKVLADYTKSKDYNSVSAELGDIQNQVIALNKVPGGTSAITRAGSTDVNSVTNSLLSLKAVVDSNKKLLSLGSGQTMVNVWLEVGSIIFKTMATNPSTLVSQKVDIQYYLPVEIKQGDIIKTDAGLTVNYDSEKAQLYVSGTFNLAAGQTRTFSVETKDIWQIPSAEIQSVRDQANTLFTPLQKTAYYAQGTTLKSDINAEMDQVAVLYTNVTTPEEKIQAYRQAEILINSANTNLTAMKELVTQAGAAGNLFGFVGGAQTIAVWGLILVIAAGFIFMTIYMRAVTAKARAENVVSAPEVSSEKTKKQVHSARVHPAALVVVMLISSVISAGTSGFLVSKIVSKSYEEKISVLGARTVIPVVTPTPSPVTGGDAGPAVSSAQEDKGTGGQYLVVVSDTPTGFLRVRKTPGGVEVAKAQPGDKLPFLDEQKGWYKVSLEDGREGWVSAQYSSKQ